MNAESRLKIINNYLGWGNALNSKLIFFALEEKDPFNDQFDEMAKNFKSIKDLDVYYGDSSGRIDVGTETLQSYVSYKFKKEIFHTPNIPDTFDEFCKKPELYSDDFYSNLYPLGKKDEKSPYPKHYKSLFGLNEIEIKGEYKNRYLGERLLIIKKFIEYKIKNTEDCYFFIMGNDPWEKLLPLFVGIGIEFPNKLVFPRVGSNGEYLEEDLVYKNKIAWWRGSTCKKIWFTQHPAHSGLNRSVVDKIVATIKEDYNKT